MGSGLCPLCNHYKYFQCRAPRRAPPLQSRPKLRCTVFVAPLLQEMLSVAQVLRKMTFLPDNDKMSSLVK